LSDKEKTTIFRKETKLTEYPKRQTFYILEEDVMIRVLYVDDDINEHLMIQHSLETAGFSGEIDFVTTVIEALEKLEGGEYNCVLSDYQMTPHDGLYLLTSIRDKGNSIPFIFVTGQGSERIAANALRVGATSYFTKDDNFAYAQRLKSSIEKNVDSYLQRISSEQKQNQLDALFYGSSNLIFISSPERKILQVNKALCDLFGFSEEELIGRTLDELHDDYNIKSTFMEKWNEALNNTSASFELNVKNKAGDSIPIEMSLSFISTEGSKQVVGIGQDISERKRSNLRLLLLTRAIEQNQASVVITDTKGAIEYVNPAFCDLTGYSEEEVIGQNIRILESDEMDSQKDKDMWEKISSGKVWKGEFHNKKKNGESYWETANISPVFDENGEIINYIAIKQDITEKEEDRG
jgi:PAS domain S-box-containing protein